MDILQENKTITISSIILNILLIVAIIIPWLQPIGFALYWDVNMSTQSAYMFKLISKTGLILCIPAHIYTLAFLIRKFSKTESQQFLCLFVYLFYVAFIVYFIFTTMTDLWR